MKIVATINSNTELHDSWKPVIKSINLFKLQTWKLLPSLIDQLVIWRKVRIAPRRVGVIVGPASNPFILVNFPQPNIYYYVLYLPVVRWNRRGVAISIAGGAMVMSTERKALNQPPQPHQSHQLKQGSEPRVLIFFGSATLGYKKCGIPQLQ